LPGLPISSNLGEVRNGKTAALMVMWIAEAKVMKFQTICYAAHQAVAQLTLNRPDRLNAMNAMMLNEIGAALDVAERDESVRVLVVTGAGRAFSSGFDLKEQMEARPTGVGAWRTILTRDFATIVRFWRFPKPTIAAVQGACLAGGCELALACDLTIAAENAYFGEPELKFGAGIVAMILPWIVGPKLAKEIIFTGEDRIDATRAREIGMVNRVVRLEELETATLSLARHLAVIDPGLMQQTKRAINRAYEASAMAEALEAALAIDLQIEGEGSPDKARFMEVARHRGLRAAIAWRDERFAKAAAL
jgi:enoyl-CoA hydratase